MMTPEERRAQLKIIYDSGKSLPPGPDWLYPCPGCGRQGVKADAGHHICRRCEGYRDD